MSGTVVFCLSTLKKRQLFSYSLHRWYSIDECLTNNGSDQIDTTFMNDLKRTESMRRKGILIRKCATIQENIPTRLKKSRYYLPLPEHLWASHSGHRPASGARPYCKLCPGSELEQPYRYSRYYCFCYSCRLLFLLQSQDPPVSGQPYALVTTVLRVREFGPIEW